MNKKKKIGIGIAIVCVLVISVFIGWSVQKNNNNDKGFAKNAISVQADTVKQDEIISKIKVKGTVEVNAKEALYVNTPSTVDEVLIEVGDKVEKGQVLIKYNSKNIDDLEQQLKQAKIQLEIQELSLKNLTLPTSDTDIEKAKSAVTQSEQGIQDAISNLKQAEINYKQVKRTLEDSEKQYKTNQALYEEGALSKVELERSYEQIQVQKDKSEGLLMQIESANRVIENTKQQKIITERNLNDLLNKEKNLSYQNQVQTQKKQIELQKLQIANLNKQKEQFIQDTKSPIEGTVLSVSAKEETVANPGVPVIEVGDLSKLYIALDVNEFDSVDLREGQTVKITSDALEQTYYEGLVDKIAPIAKTKQGSTGLESVVEVKITFDGTQTILKPGYSVEAEIITKHQEKATVIPILALIKDKGGKSIVYIIREDFSIEKREIKVGSYADLYVEIEGVEVGEKVVINPNTQIKDGVFVKPLELKQSGDVE